MKTSRHVLCLFALALPVVAWSANAPESAGSLTDILQLSGRESLVVQESQESVGVQGSHFYRRFDQTGKLTHESVTDFSFLITPDRYAVKFLRADPRYEVRLLTVSTYDETYESLQSVKRPTGANKPAEPDIASAYISSTAIPSHLKTADVLQAVSLACALTSRPEMCIENGKLKDAFIPTNFLWSPSKGVKRGISVRPEVRRDAAGMILGVEFWLMVTEESLLDRTVKWITRTPSGRGQLCARLEIKDRAGKAPVHVTYTRYVSDSSGTRRYEYDFKGQVASVAAAELLGAVAPTPGTSANINDTRFPPTRFGYALDAPLPPPFKGTRAYEVSLQTLAERTAR
jgi:hypothetical protein